MIPIEEYIASEWSAENRHELIDGELIEIHQSDDTHNQIAGNFGICIAKQIKNAGYQLYLIDIKVATPDYLKIFYPDVMVTNESRTQENGYIKNAPVLLAEVVSPASHNKDYIIKCIEYTKIPSLQYYLIIEPETILITMYARSEEGWEVQKFTKLTDEISLPALGANLLLKDIYAG